MDECINNNFEDWTAIELFDFLTALHEIDPDDKVEDWDRVSLLEIARDLDY